MKMTDRRMKTETMVLGAMMTALVVVLQLIGAAIKFGPFSVSLVLIPIVIGAAVCGPVIGAWLGLVFGAVVLLSGDAAWFLSISAVGTVITVMLKGMLCGLVPGIVYKALKSQNKYAAAVSASLLSPVINSGVFALGCFAFFYESVAAAGTAEGYSSGVAYIFLVMIGANFLFELLLNIVLCPTVVTLIDMVNKKRK